MHSQCPQCRAIFNVPESHIGAHQGLVRCGRCQAVFHAVTNKVDGLEVLDERRPDKGEPSKSQAPAEVERHQPAPAGVDSSGRHALAPVREPSSTPDVVPGEDAGASPEPAAAVAPNEEEASRGDSGGERMAEEPEPAAVEQEESKAGDAREQQDDVEAGEDRDAGREEPILPKSGEDPEKNDFAGEVEEILIEAPPVLWNAFDEDTEDLAGSAAVAADSASERAAGAESATTPRRVAAAPAAGGGAAGARRVPLKTPHRARDVRMVELPQPRPFKTASLSLLSVFLVLLLVWQVKTFYLDDLAQFPIARPYLEIVCRTLGCSLPPRRNFAEIDLVGTSINVNPEVPGALEIKASLMNRAHFPQPYPPLRVTLTDRDGRIVGRRTYLPSDYRPDGASELLPIKAKRNVSINLAQPAENAVGYEVELVAPVSGNSQ